VKGELKQYKKCGAPIHTSRAIHPCPYHDETQSMSQEMPLGSKQNSTSYDFDFIFTTMGTHGETQFLFKIHMPHGLKVAPTPYDFVIIHI
jgi:hypothetical protein